MSTTQEVLNEVSTFHEDTTNSTNHTTQRTGLVEGNYLGHIANVRSTVHPVKCSKTKQKGRFKARIYNFDVIVADENGRMKY